MGGNLDQELIKQFLAELGRRLDHPADLFLLGGGALLLLGNARSTLDLDYVGDDLKKDELQQAIDVLAGEMQIAVEAVPFEGFVPISEAARARHYFVGRFNALDVYVFDPYSIAVSKLDRGFDTDIADVAFLIRRKLVDLSVLQAELTAALTQAQEFNLNPESAHTHFDELRRTLRKID
jgi:hypothetical protein